MKKLTIDYVDGLQQQMEIFNLIINDKVPGVLNIVFDPQGKKVTLLVLAQVRTIQIEDENAGQTVAEPPQQEENK